LNRPLGPGLSGGRRLEIGVNVATGPVKLQSWVGGVAHPVSMLLSGSPRAHLLSRYQPSVRCNVFAVHEVSPTPSLPPTPAWCRSIPSGWSTQAVTFRLSANGHFVAAEKFGAAKNKKNEHFPPFD